MATGLDLEIRPVRRDDAAAIAAIDALHTGTSKVAWWRDTVARHLRESGSRRVGLVAVDAREQVQGYVLAQVRAFEFGSDECGWVYALGVHPEHLRRGIARALLDEARRRVAALGVPVVRTMVRRDDVPVLTFFRSEGFVLGPYAELELTLSEPPYQEEKRS